MEDFFTRLDKYMEYSGLNDNQVTVQAGLSQGALGKQRKGSRGLSVESIAKLLHTYSDLSAEWLLTGQGNMLKKTEALPTDGSQAIILSLSKSNELLVETNKQLSETIAALVNKKTPNVPREDGAVFADAK